MTSATECIGENDDLVVVAQKLRDLDVAQLPVCDDEHRLKGVITIRDLVVKCLAIGADPRAMRAGDLIENAPVTIGIDDSLESALEILRANHLSSVPVLDGNNLVGTVKDINLHHNPAPPKPDQELSELSARDLPNTVLYDVFYEQATQLKGLLVTLEENAHNDEDRAKWRDRRLEISRHRAAVDPDDRESQVACLEEWEREVQQLWKLAPVHELV